MTTDNDMGMFREKLNELVASKDKLTDEEVAAKVDELKGFTADLPGDEDKAKLDRFLDDFKAVKEQDEAAAKEAAGMVADLFEKLDTEAMKDVPEPEEAAPAEEPAAAEAAPEPTEEVTEAVEETVAPEAEEGEPEDADPEANADYTLEEIYQFIKKRMAEDAACQDEAPEAEEEVEEEEKDEEEVVTDHAAPFIPITVNNNTKATGSLAEMFAKAKGGR